MLLIENLLPVFLPPSWWLTLRLCRGKMRTSSAGMCLQTRLKREPLFSESECSSGLDSLVLVGSQVHLWTNSMENGVGFYSLLRWKLFAQLGTGISISPTRSVWRESREKGLSRGNSGYYSQKRVNVALIKTVNVQGHRASDFEFKLA